MPRLNGEFLHVLDSLLDTVIDLVGVGTATDRRSALSTSLAANGGRNGSSPFTRDSTFAAQSLE